MDSSRNIPDRLHYLVSIISLIALCVLAFLLPRPASADDGLSAIDPDVAEIYDYNTLAEADAACTALKGSSCNSVTSTSWHPDHWSSRYWRQAGVSPAVRHTFGYPPGTCADSDRWDGYDETTGECTPPPECEADKFAMEGYYAGVSGTPTCDSGCVVEDRSELSVKLGGVDGDRWGEWYENGQTCSVDELPGDDTLVDDAGETWTPAVDFAENCGTFNGVAICVDSIPSGGKCITDSGTYTCANPSSQNVVPEHDPSTETVEITDGPSNISWTNQSGTVEKQLTASQGTITAGADLETGSTDPQQGGEGSGIEGEETEEPPGFCEEAPDLCDTSAEVTDPGAVPQDSVDVGNLRSDYVSPIATDADCPAPYSFDVFGSSYDLPYTGFCDLAALIRPLVIAMAYLFGLFFAVRTLS